jgi:hypothetical protein
MRAVFLHRPKVEDGNAWRETSILPLRSAQDQFYFYCQSHQHVLEEILCPTCESFLTTSQLRAAKLRPFVSLHLLFFPSVRK